MLPWTGKKSVNKNGGGEGTLTYKFLYRKDYIFILKRMLDAQAGTPVVSAPSSLQGSAQYCHDVYIRFRFH